VEQTASYPYDQPKQQRDLSVIAMQIELLEQAVSENAKSADALADRLASVLRPADPESVGQNEMKAAPPLRSTVADQLELLRTRVVGTTYRISRMLDALEI
jgi:hypothetical protein